MTTQEWDGQPVDPAFFGRDHWSTLLYTETRVVDYGGVLEPKHMRRTGPGRGSHPTRLRDAGGGVLRLEGHDDYDCLVDLEAAGFLRNLGTGLHPKSRAGPARLDGGGRLAAT